MSEPVLHILREARQSEEENMTMGEMRKRMPRCPNCGSKHIDAFSDAYWFLCRDCGYQSDAYSDECEAINAFLGRKHERKTH